MSDEVGLQMICYGPADATVTPNISCFIKIQNGLTFLVPASPGCHGKKAAKRVSLILGLVRLVTSEHFQWLVLLVTNFD